VDCAQAAAGGRGIELVLGGEAAPEDEAIVLVRARGDQVGGLDDGRASPREVAGDFELSDDVLRVHAIGTARHARDHRQRPKVNARAMRRAGRWGHRKLTRVLGQPRPLRRRRSSLQRAGYSSGGKRASRKRSHPGSRWHAAGERISDLGAVPSLSARLLSERLPSGGRCG
jgi:hypothetical protein